MVVLTEEMVLAKTRAEDLASVKNLNLWGSDLTDVSILQRLPNVEVLSLSVNKIRTLQDFRHCSHLTELYLRKNEISEIREVAHLQGLKNLSILWLCDNPCVGSSPPEYRKRVIAMLPNITKLDNVDVSDEERASATPSPGSASPRTAAPAAPTPTRSKAPTPRASANGALQSPSRSSPNVLSAVLLLLKDLDADSLLVVRGEIDQRLKA